MSSVDPGRKLQHLPVHIGIIMDGNGRWAVQRNKHRSIGHREGLKTAKKIVKAASDAGVKYLSLYTFSTENWKRAEDEVAFLMKLISQNLKKEYDFYRENRIKVVHSGDLSLLPSSVQAEISDVMKDTQEFEGLVVNLAINYGGKDEIVRSVNRWLTNQRNNSDQNIEISDIIISSYLDRPEIPNPDLIIRTGGEQRLSNFLLWESAYSEYHFSEKLWPDWTEEDFYKALSDFNRRHRKFGGVN
jgi:undecaprenyl diphosphate synthase